MYKVLGVGALVIIIGASAFFIGKNYSAVTPEPVAQTSLDIQTGVKNDRHAVPVETKSAKPQPTQKSSADGFSVDATSGAAPLHVSFNAQPKYASDYVDYGDGSSSDRVGDNCAMPANFCSGNHVYSTPGSYTLMLKDATQTKVLDTKTITVTSGSTSGAPKATINQDSLIGSAGGMSATTLTLTGTATNVDMVTVTIVRNDGYAYGQGSLGMSHDAIVTNGQWSYTAKSLPVGAYTVTVRLPDIAVGGLPPGSVLATGSLVVRSQ